MFRIREGAVLLQFLLRNRLLLASRESPECAISFFFSKGCMYVTCMYLHVPSGNIGWNADTNAYVTCGLHSIPAGLVLGVVRWTVETTLMLFV
jgi:hypothetical protein